MESSSLGDQSPPMLFTIDSSLSEESEARTVCESEHVCDQLSVQSNVSSVNVKSVSHYSTNDIP